MMADDKKRIPEITDIEAIPEDDPAHSKNLSQSGMTDSRIADSGPSYTGTNQAQRRPSDDEDDPLVGKVLKGTYKLAKKIGEGGMGNVYKAIQSPLNREVAVKLLKPSESNPEGEHYFLREVQAINMLRHPNIIGIVDFGKEPDGSLYLVMEYLPGQTLKRVIRKDFPVSPLRTCNICMQVLSALEQAHNSGIIHCDLKPANIMLEKVAGQDDFAKVLDFGIAKVKGPALEAGPYTQAGNIVGTFDYMSPEQIMRKELDGRADVWSMGVILYEMLTRKRIFHDKDAVSIIGRVMQMPIKRPSEVIDPKYQWDIPRILEDIALKAMERNIDKRFRSALEMRDALRVALKHLEDAWDGQTGRMRGDSLTLEEHSHGSGNLSRPISSSGARDRLGSTPGGLLHGDTGRTGSSSVYSRSGGFGLGDSQRLATGIAAGTSVLDQTFSIEELQSSLTGERRKVAVLAIQQRARGGKGVDPEDLARRSAGEVAIIREVVEHYEGKIDSFLGGTYTILFGADRARVGDYLRAIECGLALQERFRGLESGAAHLGIAVTYGEVYLSDRKGGTAFGAALDRAVEIARSTSDARVVADESLIEVTRQQVQYDVQKRVGGEITAEALKVRSDAPPDAGAEEQIAVDVYVPRPAQFEELSRRAADAKKGQGGGIAIIGEMGSGKSVLLQHFADHLAQTGWQTFAVRGDELEARQSLSAVRALIRQIASTYKDPSMLVRKACESIGLTQGVEAIVQLYLAPGFSQAGSQQLPWQDAESFVYFSSALFHRMIRFAMKKGPVLLAIDDIGVDDAAQQDVIDGLLEAIQSQSVLVVATRRAEPSRTDHGLPGNFEILRLGGFGPSEARQFISDALGYLPPPEVVDHLIGKSGANPMFLAEMVKVLRKDVDSTRVLTKEALEAQIPLSLHELLAQRVDELSENYRDLLAIASVLGESFREEFFAQIAPAHLGPNLILPELVRMGFLEAKYDGFERAHIAFTPRALRNVVYERLPRETRHRFHSGVIEFLEQAPELAATDPLDWAMSLAFHYKSVDGHEGAAHYLGKAGDVLLDMYDYPGAIAQYQTGRQLMRDSGFGVTNRTFATITAKLLIALRESGRIDDALGILDELGDLSNVDSDLHSTILLERGRLGANAADPEPAIQALEWVRDHAVQTRSLKLEIRALLALAQIFEAQNQLTHAGSLLVEVSQKVEQLQGGLNLQDPEDRKLYWTAYNQLGTLLIRQRDIPNAQRYLNTALRRAREIADSRGLIRILANLGALALSTRDVGTAKEYFGQALQFARATGDLLSQAKIQTNLGIALMEANDLEGSKKYFKQARTTAEEIGWHEGIADLSLHIQRLRAAIGG